MGRELEVMECRDGGDIIAKGLGLIEVDAIRKPDDVAIIELGAKFHRGSNKGVSSPACDALDLALIDFLGGRELSGLAGAMENLQTGYRELRDRVGSKMSAFDIVADVLDDFVWTGKGHAQLGRKGFVRVPLDQDEFTTKVEVLGTLGDSGTAGVDDFSVGGTRQLGEALKVFIQETEVFVAPGGFSKAFRETEVHSSFRAEGVIKTSNAGLTADGVIDDKLDEAYNLRGTPAFAELLLVANGAKMG